jgi:putative hydrolase of HD superfamily
MFDFKRAIQFTDLLERFQKVIRNAYVPGESRKENDAEHSYKLAMMAWYLAEAYQLPLDTSKIVKYALAHDLVEVHAGDTEVWDLEGQKTKHAREEAAQKLLATEWADFPGLHRQIADYEARSDEEGRFVYALDKLFYIFPEYLAEWRTIREIGITYDQEFSQKEEKTRPSEIVHEWCLQVLAELKKEEARLWGSSAS